MNKLWESQGAPKESIVRRKESKYFQARIFSPRVSRLKWPGKDTLLHSVTSITLQALTDSCFSTLSLVENCKQKGKRCWEGLRVQSRALIEVFPYPKDMMHTTPYCFKDRAVETDCRLGASRLGFWSTLQHVFSTGNVIFLHFT